MVRKRKHLCVHTKNVKNKQPIVKSLVRPEA
jgi:hypothetical protein